MTSLEHIAKKMHELSRREKPVELSPKRMRSLRSILNTMKGVIETNAGIGTDNLRLTGHDLEEVGAMEYLLNGFFPEGNIPPELRPYAEFVSRIKGIDAYNDVVNAKLQRDRVNLKRRDSVCEADDPLYARTFVNVVESDELIPETSRLLVTFDNQTLYEENIPDYVFRGLPDRSTIVFEYTSQGLNLDLQRTLQKSSRAKLGASGVEKAVIDSLASDVKTKGYVDSLYCQINEELSR